MAGISETREYNSLLTTTLADYRDVINDQIFDDYPLLSYINGKLGKALRGRSIKRMQAGGESIVEPLLYEQNSTVDSYSGAETIDTTLQDGHTIARYSWKQYAATIGITGIERRSNRGEARITSLMEAKTKQAIMSVKDRMSVDAWSDGTGNSSKNLTGMTAILSTTATLGGLAPATFSWWVASVTGTVGSFASGGEDAMRIKVNDVSFGNDKPDVIFCPQAVHEFFEKSQASLRRYTSDKAQSVGFDNIMFKSMPVIFDRDAPSGTMAFLNSNYLSFVVDPEVDIATGEFVTPENQDVSTAKILFQGNLTTNNRRKLGYLTGITA